MHLGKKPTEGAWKKNNKPTNQKTAPPQNPHPTSVSRAAGRGATEMVIMNLLLQTTTLGHGSAMPVI